MIYMIHLLVIRTTLILKASTVSLIAPRFFYLECTKPIFSWYLICINYGCHEKYTILQFLLWTFNVAYSLAYHYTQHGIKSMSLAVLLY